MQCYRKTILLFEFNNKDEYHQKLDVTDKITHHGNIGMSRNYIHSHNLSLYTEITGIKFNNRHFYTYKYDTTHWPNHIPPQTHKYF